MSERVEVNAARERIRVKLEALGLDYESTLLASDITRAANAVRVHLTNAALREHDLSWTGFGILWLIWLHGPLETRHAAQAAAISKATLTGVVNTLEQRKFIARITPTDDRRLVELHLTQAGASFIESVYPAYNRAELELMRGLSDDEKANLRRGLEHLISALDID